MDRSNDMVYRECSTSPAARQIENGGKGPLPAVNTDAHRAAVVGCAGGEGVLTGGERLREAEGGRSDGTHLLRTGAPRVELQAVAVAEFGPLVPL